MNLNEKELKDLIREEVEASVKESREAGGKSEEKAESVVSANINVEDVAKQVAESIVKGVQEIYGGNNNDAKSLQEKIYTPEKGFAAIKYPSIKELDNLTDNEKIAVYFKALVRREKSNEDHQILKGLSEGTAADGGNLVPVPLYNEVMRLLPDIAIMRRLAEVIPMTSKTLEIPTQTTEPQAYWIGERQTKTTTSVEFGKITLTANKLVARVLMSEELNDDAIVSLVPWITRRFAEAIATKEDQAFFTGSGSGQPKGINQESLTSISAGGNLTFDKVIQLYGLPRQSVRNSANAAFVAHHSVLQQLRQLKDSNGAYLWRIGGETNGQVGRLPETLHGYPIYEQNDLATSELYFGDWSKYLIGDRKQMTVRTTMENETAWTQDAIDIKAVERVDGRAVFTGAFAKITGI